jgi:hypothetical protein
MTQTLLLAMALLIPATPPDTFDVQGAIQASLAPHPDSVTQPIEKLSRSAEGVTDIVQVITVRTIVDHEGRYGRPDASHKLTETTTFRDRWVRVSDHWKLKSREQIGGPSESVDQPE